MICPHCRQEGSRVIDSRPADDGSSIRRRRECPNCGFRFTTFERYEEIPLLVIKKDGSREPFNRQKLLNGLIRSAEKRSVGMQTLTEIADKVESQARRLGETEISTQAIGEFVMNELKPVDEIAYIRFASVYREFKDVEAFRKEIESMEKK
ncbi:Transcriptional repressor nrdR [Limosilactobacillus gastricus PS3]|uniref:Transcriptional repressor NrdR n=1 Tax=Limosilactobacillus gastricus PS3 TaxID=1144300 RepID=H4GI73_9LACO|nr:transcriptional regulator NrdR [Limosilactobacillus gastricus]EHS87412.1 Transcriptional repressor nrdR [Limosilactobacillus gastricus PS3]